MEFGTTVKTAYTVIEELRERFDDLRDDLETIRGTTEKLKKQGEAHEAQLTSQQEQLAEIQVLVKALAEHQGLDVEALLADVESSPPDTTSQSLPIEEAEPTRTSASKANPTAENEDES